MFSQLSCGTINQNDADFFEGSVFLLRKYPQIVIIRFVLDFLETQQRFFRRVLHIFQKRGET